MKIFTALLLSMLMPLAYADEQLEKEIADPSQKYSKERVKHRIVCDYISGMTDDYAARFYERLFLPRRGPILDPL